MTWGMPAFPVEGGVGFFVERGMELFGIFC